MEFASGGLITCEELRPDLLWARTRDRTWPGGLGRPVLEVSKTKGDPVPEGQGA